MMFSSIQRHYLLGGILMLNYLKRFIPCNDDPINKLLFDICSQLEIKRYVRYEPVTDHFYIPLDILTGVLGIRISRMYGFEHNVENTPLHWLINLKNFEFWLSD